MDAAGVHRSASHYVSQHAAYGAAAATVLASVFGRNDFDFMLTTHLPWRRFPCLQQLLQERDRKHESASAWPHFPAACRHGLNQGKQVTNFVVHYYLQPIK